MPHLEHDQLVFLALDESAAEDFDRTHLESCPHCRRELEDLRQVAGLGAASQGLRQLPDPPAPTTVLASAPLAAYGSTPPQARGDARVLDSGKLHLHVVNLPAVTGYYEV